MYTRQSRRLTGSILLDLQLLQSEFHFLLLDKVPACRKTASFQHQSLRGSNHSSTIIFSFIMFCNAYPFLAFPLQSVHMMKDDLPSSDQIYLQVQIKQPEAVCLERRNRFAVLRVFDGRVCKE